MGIRVYVGHVDAIKNMEIAYKMISMIEEKYKKKIFEIENFTSRIAIQDFLNPLVRAEIIDEEFLDFVREEYGEPWVDGYPIDGAIVVDSISKWTNLSEEDSLKYLSFALAFIAFKFPSVRLALYREFDSCGFISLYIDPIDKKYRNIKFTKGNMNVIAKDLTKENYDSIFESTEVILALTEDELIKEQILNIKKRIFGTESASKIEEE